jgi:hypothetical protein
VPIAETRAMQIPVMGRIAAGTPISAIQNRSHSITVSPEFLGGGEHYALEVRGDSMMEAGILDGDTVVIKRQDTANTGDIIVALIDEDEATLKRFAAAARPSRSRPRTRPTRPASSGLTGSRSRASSSAWCAATRGRDRRPGLRPAGVGLRDGSSAARWPAARDDRAGRLVGGARRLACSARHRPGEPGPALVRAAGAYHGEAGFRRAIALRHVLQGTHGR